MGCKWVRGGIVPFCSWVVSAKLITLLTVVGIPSEKKSIEIGKSNGIIERGIALSKGLKILTSGTGRLITPKLQFRPNPNQTLI